MSKLIHLLKTWPCGGGMEAVVRLHIKRGERVIAVSGNSADGVTSLGQSPNASIRSVRSAIASEVGPEAGSACVLHYNGHGIDWFNGNQRLGRHMIYFHSDFPNRSKWLRRLMPYAEGGFSVSQPLADSINQRFSLSGASSVSVVPVPVDLPDQANAQMDKPSPMLIGYAGRILRSQKRLDRLPAFLDELESRGVAYRMEVLGDGPYRQVLERRLKNRPQVAFLGHRSGDEYWSTLNRWKYMLFLSDYEGMPIALLEGLAAGVVPVYPDFHDGMDELARWGHPFLYKPGSPADAARSIQHCESDWPENEQLLFRQRVLGEISGRTTEAYHKAIESELTRETEKPAQLPAAPSVADSTPLWLYNRLVKASQTGWTSLLAFRSS